MYAKSPLVRGVSLVPVLLVWALFALEWYCFNAVYAAKVLRQFEGAAALRLVVPFNALWLLALWSLLRCTFSDPGTVPEEWLSLHRSQDQDDDDPVGRDDWQFGIVTVCYKCQERRPERAHHCSICNRCMLRMDHHCPWIGNCVGFKNHKYFLLLGLYGTGACVFFLASLWSHLYALVFGRSRQDMLLVKAGLQISDRMLLSVGVIIAASFALSLGGLFATHVFLAAINRTSIEMSNSGTNPYNLGCQKNIEQLFGTFDRTWLLPVQPGHPLADGLSYPSAAIDEEIELHEDVESQTIGIPVDGTK